MWQPVIFAEPIRHYSFDGPAFFLPCHPKNEAALVIVPITGPKPTPSLPPLSEPLLHQRAIRVCNREPRAIARYMQVHQNLSRGR